jgi:pyrimidine operon attenuation protein/uracil phosphoribosyltransferase
MKRLLSAQQVANALGRLYQQIKSGLPTDEPIAVIGIRTRGEILAQRIVKRLQEETGVRVEHGVLDITFYRDDLSLRKGMPLVRATEIDFDLDGKVVLLVDDVLQTGRSIRAALNALADFGRPKAIRLAVLIDRGGRELPITPDFLGKAARAPANTRIQLHLAEHDGDDGVFLIAPGAK